MTFGPAIIKINAIMVRIEDYIDQPLEKRKAHIKLSESCIERGGVKQYSSVMCRGLLASYLDTTIPYKQKIFACHACNNCECSNINHLYWGTPRENINDAIACGTQDKLSVRQRTIAKHGLQKANQLLRNAFNKSIERRRLLRQMQFGSVEEKPKLNSQLGTVWIVKDSKEMKIKKEFLERYLDAGWIRGRAIEKFVPR